MKKLPSLRLFAVGVLALLLGGALSGCGGARDEDEARQTAKQQIESDAGEAKKQVDALKGATMQGGELSGGDAQGRPLWRISAKEIRVFNQPAADAGKTNSDKAKKHNGDADSAQFDKQVAKLSAQPRRAELKEARAMLYKEGKLDATFVAPRVVVNYTPDGARILMVGGISAKSEGGWAGKRGVVTMHAPRAEVNVKTRKVWASGGVHLTQGTGQDRILASSSQMQAETGLKTTRLIGTVKADSSDGQFSAQEAAWNWETHHASARGDIVATHDKTTITGAQLEADSDTGSGTLSGGVRAVGEQGKASAASVHYDWKKHTLLASGGVLLDKGDATLQSGQLATDDKFNSAIASGGVTLKKGDATLRASRVSTQGKGETATAAGSVVLVKGDAQISAATATATNLGQKNSVVVASGDVRLHRSDLTITANRAQATGLQDKSTLRVVASGDVYAKSKDGAVRAGSATWGGGRIIASNGVTLYRDGHRLSGSRLICDDQFTHATLSGSISGQLAKGGTISAKQMTYRKGQGVVATGGVAARRGELRLRADNMTATPDGNHLLLTGHVVVTNAEGASISAPEVRYDRVAQKVYASGDVYLHDPKRGLRQRGRKLVADLKLNKATLTDVSGSGKMEVFKDKKLF
jgi:lipopolysaccharide assembly outer membrane protein LptD (OstA)